MRRPPAELRRLEDEERRGALAHRRLHRQRRLRLGLLILVAALLLGAIGLAVFSLG